MKAAKIRMRVFKIFCWTNYLKANPLTEEANYWYNQYYTFAINYDFM